ncbi:MAG: glycosyltransferase [Candidatus Kerfeldbacteria bacterium]
MVDLKHKKIAIFSHDNEGTTGTDDEIVRYLLKQGCKKIVNIKFPFRRSSDGAIRLKFFDNTKATQKKSRIKFYRPEPVSYVKDLILGFWYGIKYAKGFDLFFGMNNLLACVGIALKKVGVVKQVAYYVIDYTPVRYQNTVMNRIYYAIDRFALYHSNFVVPLNEHMLKGRIHDHHLDHARIRFCVAPYGNNSLSYRADDFRRYDKNKIVYFGAVLKMKGVELFVDIAKQLIHKGHDNFLFEVVGGGDVVWLREQIKDNKLENRFRVHGRIDADSDIEKILLQCSVALAPYYPEDRNNFSYFADPGKIKIYLGCGLPIVITDVPPIAKDIVHKHAGLIARYDADDIAGKIVDIWENYGQYKNNAIAFGKEFDWNIIFGKLFTTLFTD